MIPGHVLLLSDPSTLKLFQEIETALKLRIAHVTHLQHADDLDPKSEPWLSADVFLTYGSFPCNRDLLASSGRLRAIACPWTGTEGFDEAAATQLGIAVANGHAEENTFSVAEATVLLMLASLYDLHGTEKVLRENRPRPQLPIARMLRGKRIGLVGFGGIGSRVANLLAPWGAEIVAYDRAKIDDPHVRTIDLATLLATSDIISLHVGLSHDTYHLLNRENLKLVKRGAILVNTARGSVIDETALYEAACDGRFAKIALDVFAEEPLSPVSPLRDLPNAILTPHMIAQTVEARAAFIPLAVENVTRLLQGELPAMEYLRNPGVAARWLTKWGNPSGT